MRWLKYFPFLMCLFVASVFAAPAQGPNVSRFDYIVANNIQDNLLAGGGCLQADVLGNILLTGSPCASGSAIALINGTSPIVASTVGTTATISCPTCNTSSANVVDVASDGSATDPITVSPTSGHVIVRCPTCLTNSSAPNGWPGPVVIGQVSNFSGGTTSFTLNVPSSPAIVPIAGDMALVFGDVNGATFLTASCAGTCNSLTHQIIDANVSSGEFFNTWTESILGTETSFTTTTTHTTVFGQDIYVSCRANASNTVVHVDTAINATFAIGNSSCGGTNGSGCVQPSTPATTGHNNELLIYVPLCVTSSGNCADTIDRDFFDSTSHGALFPVLSSQQTSEQSPGPWLGYSAVEAAVSGSKPAFRITGFNVTSYIGYYMGFYCGT